MDCSLIFFKYFHSHQRFNASNKLYLYIYISMTWKLMTGASNNGRLEAEIRNANKAYMCNWSEVCWWWHISINTHLVFIVYSVVKNIHFLKQLCIYKSTLEMMQILVYKYAQNQLQTVGFCLDSQKKSGVKWTKKKTVHLLEREGPDFFFFFLNFLSFWYISSW